LETASLNRTIDPDRSSAVKLYPDEMETAPRVLEVMPTRGCQIWLRFEDGLEAEIDLSDMVEPEGFYSRPLKDPDYFRRVAIYPGGHGIFWPNEADVCPDALYRRALEATGVAA
jgi:hypothetical protein